MESSTTGAIKGICRSVPDGEMGIKVDLCAYRTKSIHRASISCYVSQPSLAEYVCFVPGPLGEVSGCWLCCSILALASAIIC